MVQLQHDYGNIQVPMDVQAVVIHAQDDLVAMELDGLNDELVFVMALALEPLKETESNCELNDLMDERLDVLVEDD